jgi:hypothetical protein
MEPKYLFRLKSKIKTKNRQLVLATEQETTECSCQSANQSANKRVDDQVLVVRAE